jgi:hypothetical protein
MDQDQPGAVAEQAPFDAVVVNNDHRVVAIERQFAVDVVEYESKKLQYPTQRVPKRGGANRRLAHQPEAASSHRVAVDAEKLIIEKVGKRNPQPRKCRRRNARLGSRQEFRVDACLLQGGSNIQLTPQCALKGFVHQAD